MKKLEIHIYNNGDNTYHLAINSRFGCEDSSSLTWEEVIKILSTLTPPT